MDINIYLKYASKPLGRYKEYRFTFNKDNLDELRTLKELKMRLFICLICVFSGQICCVPYSTLIKLINQRINKKGKDEDNYTIIATLPFRRSFQIYMNSPKRKNIMIGEMIIPQDNYLKILFQES